MNIKQEFNERISEKTISDKWRKIRKISAIICSTGGLVLAMPITIPAKTEDWISWIILAAGIIAGRAHLDKSKLKQK